MNVIFCSSEVYPFAQTGGLGEVCGSLPSALEKIGVGVAVVLPAYRCAVRAGIEIVPINGHVSRAAIGKNIAVYFIHHPYFERDGLYGDSSGDYADNIERFGFFCRQALSVIKQLSLPADIIHCHDWQTALVPVYLKELYSQDPFYARSKSLLTIHNLAFQGLFPREQYARLLLKSELFSLQGFEFYGQVNLLKGGIIYSDRITTVSPRYAQEIQTKEYGCGLEAVLAEHKKKITGILNGIDHEVRNPQKDQSIVQRYTSRDFEEAKLRNKAQLQKELSLEVRPDLPLFGFVGRMADQKGMDLILETLEDMLRMNTQVIFLGMGDKQYESRLRDFVRQNPGKMAVRFEFNEPLGHRIYAGSDFFLMPSRFEPCGLSQMISLRYGTVPIVYKTGGLADTVQSFETTSRRGNGFVFSPYTREAYGGAVQSAVKIFAQKEFMHRLRSNGFDADFSWEASARKYRDIYRCM